jgi:hypothetical protein
MPLRIEKLDHEGPAARERVFGFPAPHETHNLFIPGNLNTRFPGAHLYVAERANRWVGVAGY